MMGRFLLFIALFSCSAAAILFPTMSTRAGAAKVESPKSYEIDVPGKSEWVDTKIDLHGGAKLRFAATGKITYPPDDSYQGKSRTLGTFGPAGLARGWADLIHQYAVKDAGHGALIGPNRR